MSICWWLMFLLLLLFCMWFDFCGKERLRRRCWSKGMKMLWRPTEKFLCVVTVYNITISKISSRERGGGRERERARKKYIVHKRQKVKKITRKKINQEIVEKIAQHPDFSSFVCFFYSYKKTIILYCVKRSPIFHPYWFYTHFTFQ